MSWSISFSGHKSYQSEEEQQEATEALKNFIIDAQKQLEPYSEFPIQVIASPSELGELAEGLN